MHGHAEPAAGLDLKELADGGANLVGGHDDGGARWTNPIQAVWEVSKPVIGAVNGACITGGFELALGCDFLVASDRAFFATLTRVRGSRRGAVRHLKQLYDHNAHLTVGDALAHEHEVFRTYRVDFDAIEQRRESVVERGRAQR